MAIPIEVLEAEALSLPSAERSKLVDRLLETLNFSPEWELAWAAEADWREAQIALGEAAWIPASEVIAKAHAMLR